MRLHKRSFCELRAHCHTALTSGSISAKTTLPTSPSASSPRGTLPPPVKGSKRSLGRCALLRIQPAIVGTSQVFPPGYRKGEICRTDETFTMFAIGSASTCVKSVAMSLLQIGEIFGHDISLPGLPHPVQNRIFHPCAIRGNNCAKQSRNNPLSICSFTDGQSATVVCPVRFLEKGKMFKSAANIAFGAGVSCVAVPEFHLLEVVRKGRKSKIGKVDFLLVKMEAGAAVDFAPLEVQAVYISGNSIRPAYEHYLESGQLSEGSMRRPDFRSSAQKRLMPQLALKVPIFRRWNKRFFVAVDQTFFNALPPLKERSVGNSEITWLVYDFQRQQHGGFEMQAPTVIHTIWDDVQEALREGEPPEREDLLRQLTKKASKQERFTT